jgi:hypothetical protein
VFSFGFFSSCVAPVSCLSPPARGFNETATWVIATKLASIMAPYFCFFWFPPSLSFPAAPVTHSRAFRRVARRCSLLVVLHGGRPGSNARVSRGAPGGVSAGRPHRPAGLIPSLRPRCTRPIGVCAAAPSSLRVPGRGGRRLSAASTQSGWGCRCVPVFPPLRCKILSLFCDSSDLVGSLVFGFDPALSIVVLVRCFPS